MNLINIEKEIHYMNGGKDIHQQKETVQEHIQPGFFELPPILIILLFNPPELDRPLTPS